MHSKPLLLLAATLTTLTTLATAQTTLSCPGVVNVQDQSTACCVGGVIPPLTLSSCAGWPICTGPVTVTTTSEPISCATIIPATASDYDALVSSAAASLSASGTNYQTEIVDGSTMTAAASESGNVTGTDGAAGTMDGSAGTTVMESAAATSGASGGGSESTSASAATSSSAGVSGGLSATGEMRLQVGLVVAGLVVAAGAFLL